MDFIVYGSDIDETSVEEGQNAVYHRRDIETAPRHFWEHNCTRGKDDIADWYKIKSNLREKTKFFKMNLLSPDLPSSEKFDVIFMRNVLIYFDKDNQVKICKSVLSHLKEHGTLITGVSESLSGFVQDIKTCGPSIYKKTTAPVAKVQEKTATSIVIVPRPLKVFCIDDSPTVITILKKILAAPDFEIIGSAVNGEDAIEKLKTIKPDVITLDLHMPVMDGPTFLLKTDIARRIPVVIVSSVDREDPIIGKINNAGVTDFVEKPTLTNMSMIGEELAQKLTSGWKVMKKGENKGQLSQTLHKKKRSATAVIFNFGPGDEEKVVHVLKELPPGLDTARLLFNGDDSKLRESKEKLKKLHFGIPEIDTIFMREKLPKLPIVWLHFANGSVDTVKRKSLDTDYLLIEEKKGVAELSGDDISPYTSFSYLIDKVVGGE
jgi:chemotaxis protein methyltransferase CheR